MVRRTFVAMSGAVLKERRLEVLRANRANVNAADFKKREASLRGAAQNPCGARTFAGPNGVAAGMTPGMTENTDRKFDVAIKGDGLAVDTINGSGNSRDGSFTTGAHGTLITENKAQGEKCVIKLTPHDVIIDATGVVQNIFLGGK